MKRSRSLKTILASLLVTVALAAPAAMLSSETAEVEAELYFTGVSLKMLSDGSVQAIFKVSVDKVLNCDGASFVLDYNPDYFTPSYMVETTDANGNTHAQNEAYVSTTNAYDPGYFAYDPALYKEDVNPFQEEVTYQYFDGNTVKVSTSKYSTVAYGQHTITMDLWIDQEEIIKNPPSKSEGKLTPLRGVSLGGQTGNENGTVYVINKYDTLLDTDGNVDLDALEPVVLGRLSFRVEPDRLDEIARYFPKPKDDTEVEPTEDPVRTVDGVESYLIRTTRPLSVSGRDNWQIGVFQRKAGATDALSKRYYRLNYNYQDDAVGLSKLYYKLAVDPKQLMKVRPAEEEVTINAYEAFTDGTWGDIAQALRRYSPMATATYVDGTQENLVIPWGETEDGYEYTITVKGTDGKFHRIDQPDNYSIYNPLEGVYQITQKIKKANGSFHPIPIKVTLTVTPIHLLDVEVENQVLTYNLATVVDEVKNPSHLLLPEKARLITNIVPSGVSMVMKIPAWTQQDPENTRKVEWPVLDDSNADTLLHALKEDSCVFPATKPYWPGEADRDDIGKDVKSNYLKEKGDNWIGEYTFRMSETYGGEVKSGFTREEIRDAFPWLTVEEDSYAVPEVLRQIVTDTNLTDTNIYTASYVSTKVLDDEGLVPELTLAVRKGNDIQVLQMNADSIFRVWLPNGEELGTGQNISVWPNHSDTSTDENTVPNWFPQKVVGDKTEQNGNYHTEGQGIEENTASYFHLVMNAGDPTTGGEETFPLKRETLRRYINLGGWYKVAVCEDPETRTWSDPMPVYVPPRPNEYKSDKEYNFVAENADLFNWPGGLTHYVTMPQGTYTAVTEDGVRLYDVTGQNGASEVLTVAQIKEKADAQKAAEEADKDKTEGGETPSPTPTPTTPDESVNSAIKYGDFLDDKGRPKSTTLRHMESYGYHTTYNGSTGAQPGTLYSFQVNSATGNQPKSKAGDPWVPVQEDFKTAASAIPAGVDIWRYGPHPFYDGAIYPAYGEVTQPTDAGPYQVTVRKSDGESKGIGKPKITLTSDSPTGITREDPNNIGSNVILATYDTRTQRYTDRQEYTFTITNIGDAPIYGMAIDGLTDGYEADTIGGRFEMLVPPASFLAPGQSTNFVLTYVYNLGPNGSPNPEIYRDTLYITSSDHPTAKKGGTNQNKADTIDNYDYLLDFDAEFRVTGDITHNVTVKVKPKDLSMGSAGLIVGKQPNNTMNYTVTTRSYAAGDLVYVAVYMKDEYKLLQTPTAKDASDKDLKVTEFTSEENGNIVLQPGIVIYTFEMPDYDTTVTVEFYEDIWSKLRLSDIVDFSAPKEERLKPYTNPVAGEDPEVDGKDTFRVWRKSYTKDERRAAQKWVEDNGNEPDEDLYLMTAGTAIPRDEGGRAFIDTENQYIVVIPYEAAFSQVEAKLRKLVTYNNYEGETKNLDIKPDVVMHHYGADIRKNWNLTVDTADKKYDSKDDTSLPQVGDKRVGDTSVPTVHTSDIFDSPVPGTSNYVRITVSYTQDGVTTRRYYYLEIHRKPLRPEATQNYGNSPYGMIMNADRFHGTTALQTEEAQNKAKEAFRNNGYSFNHLSPDIPNVILDDQAVSEKAVYWREAWVRNTKLFEPESLTGFDVTYPTPSPTPTPDPGAEAPEPSETPVNTNQREPVIAPNSSVYVEAENLDLNDYAYFAILGEDMREPGIAKALDSTGRAVDLDKIYAQVTVTLLDTEASTQIGRFSGAETATLDLGVAGRRLAWQTAWPLTPVKPAAPGGETTYALVENIRPGQYVLKYTYKDYDDTFLEVTRPLVILSSVGDVNSDVAVDLTDEQVLKNRVADPLGYVAGRWEQNAKGAWEETVYPRANIFKYRVVDVNNDRNVNNIDGNLIHKIVPQNNGTTRAKAIRFYNPVNYGID